MSHIIVVVLLSILSYADDIESLSAEFLGKPYVFHPLKGSITQKEKLVTDINKIDCFTLIDYIEALKGESFKSSLIDIRYKNGIVSYQTRNHFFSDWREYNQNIIDVTCKVGKCNSVEKKLNLKNPQEKTKYLKGIKITPRTIHYTHIKTIDKSKLKSGDYIGVYSSKIGLDVTHVGVLIKRKGKLYLRHASSKLKKVVDSPFWSYFKNKKGVVVYRSTVMVD